MFLNFLIAWCLVLPALWVPQATAPDRPVSGADETRRVGVQEVYEAMRVEQRKGYSLTATPNGGRFLAGVVLQLARKARARDPEGPPLFVGHEDYFSAYLRVTGLAPEDAPTFVRIAYEHRQDQLIEYRPHRVIDTVEAGPRPRLAVSVKSWWPDDAGMPSSYSYRDTLSSPNLLVSNARVVTYKLLDWGDRVVFDDIRGLSGRPTTGPLALLFKVIGPGQVVRTGFTFSRDGLQVVVGTARKGIFEATRSVVIDPEGMAEAGIPDDRPDLLSLEKILRLPFKIRYVPFGP